MKFKSEVQLEALNNATVDTDKFLVSDSSTVKYRTGAQLLSDLGIAGIYVPYTGATGNVNLGTHTLSSYNLIVNHTSGSGVAASITKGGSGEALTINKTSGSGNAMSVTGGLTSLVNLTLSSIPNATIDTDRFIVSDGGAIKYRTGAEVLSDIGGQPALTNPITGTGTTNYVPKFTGATSLGNSQIFDNGTNVGIGTTSPDFNLQVENTSTSSFVSIVSNNTSTAGLLLGDTDSATVGRIEYDNLGNFMSLYTSGSERMRITSGGNLLLGTTADNGARLQVSGAGTFSSSVTAGGVTVSGGNTLQLSGGTGNNWQLYKDGSNGLQFYLSGGGPAMYINSAGNVGIGTTSPQAPLHITGVCGPGSSGSLSLAAPATGGGCPSYLIMGNNDSAGAAGPNVIMSANRELLFGTGNSFSSASGGTFSESMRISSTGNVGIGTTSPSTKLDVNGSVTATQYNILNSNQTISIANTSDIQINAAVASSNILFRVSGDERMRITSGGNVGIGVIPQSWWGSRKAIEVFNGGAFTGVNAGWVEVWGNSYLDAAAATSRYLQNGFATLYQSGNVASGGHLWYTAPSGAAGNPISFTQAMTLNASGNLGIGTTSPLARLSVRAADNTSSNFSFEAANGSGNSLFYVRNDGLIGFANASSEAMRITPTGNVGIGTSSPEQKLHVEGTILLGNQENLAWAYDNGQYYNYITNFYDTSTGMTFRAGSWTSGNNIDFSFQTYLGGAWNSRMVIKGDGNVGIGTTDFFENAKLTVQGGLVIRNGGIANAPNQSSVVLDNNAGISRLMASGISTWDAVLALNPYGGNVGIGTTNPSKRLEVWEDNISTTTTAGLKITNFSITTDTRSGIVFQNYDNNAAAIWSRRTGSTAGELIFGTNSATGIAESNITEKMRITSAGNVGIGTTSPSARLDVNGDALINGLTIGVGGGYISTNTAIGKDALDSNTSGNNNIAIGYKANENTNASGLTAIGVEAKYKPDLTNLGDNCLSINQYNPNFTGEQVPHFYAPDKIFCPNGGTVTDLLSVNYNLYTAVFMDYSIFNADGDLFRAGTYTVAMKSTGSTVEKDTQTVVWNNTTLDANFTTGGFSSTSMTIQLKNDDIENFYIRFTARLLMR